MNTSLQRTTFTLFFTVSFLALMAQSTPMVSDGNVWFERGSYGGWGIYDAQERYITHYFDGDTLINGTQYKKLYKDFRDTIFSNPIYVQDQLVYEAAMRQDGDLVYFIQAGATTEMLYADFDISVGDVLNYYQNGQNNTVLAIDSFPLGNTYITAYELNSGSYFYEAIGGAHGPFRDYSFGIEGGTYLACFTHYGNSVGVGPFYTAYDCTPTVITNTTAPTALRSVKIFPNPTNDLITIQRENNAVIKIRLTDLFGRQLLYQQGAENVISLSTEHLVAGVYFIIMEENGHTFSRRFIKQ